MRDSQLMQQAMAESGCLAQKEIAGDLVAFNAIGLTGAERLSVVAGVVASVTAKRHASEQARFLQQLHELTRPATGGSSMDSGMALEPRAEQIAIGIPLLDAAFARPSVPRQSNRCCWRVSSPRIARTVSASLCSPPPSPWRSRTTSPATSFRS